MLEKMAQAFDSDPQVFKIQHKDCYIIHNLKLR